MAKKKKHRKTRKQKIAKATNQSTTVVTTSAQAVDINEPAEEQNQKVTTKRVKTKNNDQFSEVDSESLRYVKHDVARSLSLLGIILVVFVAIYFVLKKTSVVTQVYSIIKF